MSDELVVISPEQFKLTNEQAVEITKDLNQILAEREVLKESYAEVIQLEITKENIPVFKALRSKIRDNRTQGIEKWHKANKEFYLRGGQFVDAIKRKEIAENERMEENLKSNEDYFDNLEKERLQAIQDERVNQVKPYVEDADMIDFKWMEQDVFDAYLSAKKKAYDEKIEAERVAEEKRQAEIKAEEARLEAQRIENERLKKQAEEVAARHEKLRPYISLIRDYDKVLSMNDCDFDAEIKLLNKAAIEEANLKHKQQKEAEAKKLQEEKDREILARKLKREQEEKAKLQAEIDAKNKLEADELQAIKDKEVADAKAPIKVQMTNWVNLFKLPETKSENELSIEIKAKFESFKDWSLKQIEKL
jgi:hypothetical protein